MKHSRLAVALSAALVALQDKYSRRIFDYHNIKHAVTQARKGKYYGNTSCYMPHQGKRECARRRRQMGIAE